MSQLLKYATSICLNCLHAACLLSSFSSVWLFAVLWTAAHQTSLSMGFSSQEYWSGLPFPSPGDLPDPGIKPSSLMSPASVGRFFTARATWEALTAWALVVGAWHMWILEDDLPLQYLFLASSVIIVQSYNICFSWLACRPLELCLFWKLCYFESFYSPWFLLRFFFIKQSSKQVREQRKSLWVPGRKKWDPFFIEK